jgi:hypothetical protein
VASTLTQLALEFVVFHEVGHVLLGHVDYLSGSTGHALAEFSNPTTRVSDIRVAERHYLELSADRVGEWNTLRLFFSMTKTHNFDSAPAKITTFGLAAYSRAHGVFMWSVAVCVVFLCLGSWSGTEADLKGATHPLPLLRWMQLTSRNEFLNGELFKRLLTALMATNPGSERWTKLAASVNRIQGSTPLQERLKATMSMRQQIDPKLRPYVEQLRQKPPILDSD